MFRSIAPIALAALACHPVVGVLTDPDPAPDGGTEDTADQPELPDFEDPALVGTWWTSTLEGSLGTYVTWHGFADDRLDIVREVRNGWDPGVMWTAGGTWAAEADGVVAFEWTEPLWADAEYAQHRSRWTLAPLQGDLAAKVVDAWALVDGDLWTDHALVAVDADRTTYRHVWDQADDYSGDYHEASWRAVELSFDQSPEQPSCSCEVDVRIEVGWERNDGTIAHVDDTWSWPCQVVPGPDSWRIVIDQYWGDDLDALRADWAEWVWGRYGADVAGLVEDAFFPALWFDPAAPDVLAWPGARPVLVREEGLPPEP